MSYQLYSSENASCNFDFVAEKNRGQIKIVINIIHHKNMHLRLTRLNFQHWIIWQYKSQEIIAVYRKSVGDYDYDQGFLSFDIPKPI